MSMYRWVQRIMRLLRPFFVGPVKVEGTGHVPRTGPFILMGNHRSLLDPVLIQSVCPREVRTMTKSTQFRASRTAWLLRRLGAFPVRRYRTDPQAVRTALRVLEEGEGLGVYPEGERSWDGRPQPFRRGTVRLLLKAGVPVIPVGVSGSYGVWPRWARRPAKGPVAVRFGPPIELGRHDTRQERAAAFDEAEARLRAALEALLTDADPVRPTESGQETAAGGGAAST